MATTKIRQDKFDFYVRQHHKTTTLTVDRKTYARVTSLKAGEETEIEFVNDIVSSCKGMTITKSDTGTDARRTFNHEASRRVDLLRRQIATAFRNVKVRTEMGTVVNCLILGKVKGESDACTGRVTVRKRY